MGFHTFLFVITAASVTCSTSLNASYNKILPFVIKNCNDYHKSIIDDSSKELVALKDYVTPLFTEWKYASKENFTHHILYRNPDAYTRLPTAQALQKVQQQLAKKGLSLKFFDAYRPYSVTKKMWKFVPDERYAANPAKGSGHNRGAAVDVTLVEAVTGKEIPMPTGFDDFTEKAHHSYMQLEPEVIENRKILRSVMEQNGFVALETEWWHYSLPNAAAKFELLDLSFKDLKDCLR